MNFVGVGFGFVGVGLGFVGVGLGFVGVGLNFVGVGLGFVGVGLIIAGTVLGVFVATTGVLVDTSVGTMVGASVGSSVGLTGGAFVASGSTVAISACCNSVGTGVISGTEEATIGDGLDSGTSLPGIINAANSMAIKLTTINPLIMFKTFRYFSLLSIISHLNIQIL